jgi:hypothetical protein
MLTAMAINAPRSPWAVFNAMTTPGVGRKLPMAKQTVRKANKTALTTPARAIENSRLVRFFICGSGSEKTKDDATDAKQKEGSYQVNGPWRPAFLSSQPQIASVI